MNKVTTTTIAVFISLAFMLGCSQGSQLETQPTLNHVSVNKHPHAGKEPLKKSTEIDRNAFEGIVEEKRLFSAFYQILVHPGHSTGPTYFNVGKKTYDQIDAGMKVLVFEVPDGVVHFSNPPIRYAEEVKILSE
ncbi:hypothetical protein SAMN05192534_1286 [Alteribacillus persepolensis]|uniref:Uncharacterized protein n=1 Tax=Alteribacillus persepolensis TaxID=568899 RepID=A0A1G8J0V9_9BACI|nr:hypothetical protein [Alteribacillus persepolensis]SDI24905.1 hypothetical protein SAMN05192534_1286 [Alteribacillus persepolensis]